MLRQMFRSAALGEGMQKNEETSGQVHGSIFGIVWLGITRLKRFVDGDLCVPFSPKTFFRYMGSVGTFCVELWLFCCSNRIAP